MYSFHDGVDVILPSHMSSKGYTLVLIRYYFSNGTARINCIEVINTVLDYNVI